MDPRKLNAWLSMLLRVKGVDIFRLKGILHMAGSEQRYVFQGVHMQGGTARATFDGAAGTRRTWVEHLRWSPDGTLLASVAGKSLRVWNPAVGGQCIEYADHPSTVAALCWRPDGKAVGAGFYGGAALYRLGETPPYERMRWKGSVLSMAWSPNARYVAAGTQEATVNFWKLPYRPGKELNMSGYANKVKELA